MSASASPNPVDVGIQFQVAVNVTGGVPPYSFSWTGLPANCTTADSASLGCTSNASGSFSVAVTVADRNNASTATTLPVEVNPPPVVDAFVIGPSTTRTNGSTTLVVATSGGTPPYSYNYSGLPPGCATANTSTLSCVPLSAGLYPVTVSVTDIFGLSAAAGAELNVTPVGPAPTIASFVVAPANLTLGSTATFITLVSGGVPPLSYSYANLPAGCMSSNLPFLTCTPSATGVFPVVVNVADAANQSTSAETTLTVIPAPPAPLVLIGFVVYPSTVELGNLTLFAAIASGGVTPLTYTYLGLPAGCLPLPLPIVPCRPTAAGTYPVTLTVTDSAGATVASSATLVVGASTGTTPSSTASGPTPTQVVEYVALGALIGGGAVALLLVLLGRRRR